MYFFQTTLFKSAAKKVACEIDWEVDIEWEVFTSHNQILQAHFSFGLYVLYLLKLPAPPHAVLLVLYQ